MTKYEPALTDYRPLRYSHIKIAPGADYVLTADPWSYLHSYVLHDLKGRRGKNKENRERAIFYLDLAQNFYRAAEAADLPAKATLLYYGMLNLVKVWLSLSGVKLESSIEHHGLTLPLRKGQNIEVTSSNRDSISIFAEFSKALGKQVVAKRTATLKDAISQVPELHSTRQSFSPMSKQVFLRVDIQFLTDPSHRKLVTAIIYNKRTEGLVKSSKIHKGKRKKYFRDPEFKNDKVRLVCRNERKPSNWNNVTVSYQKILAEYDEFGICSLLTRGGYRYFINLEPGDYHHLAYTLMVMYYLGTAARYRPTMMREILNGPLRQSVTEACAICPKQFLYQLACRITNSVCVIPYAEV